MNKIIRPQDVIDDMMYDLVNGLDKGTTTYIQDFNESWSWRSSEVNLWTGIANEGKSTWMRFLCLIKALEENKKFCFFAPEDAPAKSFFDDLIHTLAGKSTDKDSKEFIGVDLYEKCYHLIKDLFSFIYIKPPKNTIENIVIEWEKMYQEGVYGFIIDPFVRMSKSKDCPERDDLAAAYLMSILTDFGREHKDVSIHMVMHQGTPKRLETGLYPEPSMYAIKSGGTYADMADNIISVWRPLYAKNSLDTEVRIKSQKIKKQKLVGVPSETKFRYSRKKNRYTEFTNEEQDIYNFDKWITETKPKLRF